MSRTATQQPAKATTTSALGQSSYQLGTCVLVVMASFNEFARHSWYSCISTMRVPLCNSSGESSRCRDACTRIHHEVRTERRLAGARYVPPFKMARLQKERGLSHTLPHTSERVFGAPMACHVRPRRGTPPPVTCA